jgi:putative transposase
VLGVTRARFYACKRRPASQRELRDRELCGLIGKAFTDSRETYGASAYPGRARERARPPHFAQAPGAVDAAARDGGGLPARQATRDHETGGASARRVRPRAAPLPGPGPDRLWVADITYVPTWEGYLFLARVLDAWSRRCLGLSMRGDLKAELVVDALGMAVTRPDRPGPPLRH